jgi:Fic family protein
MSRPYSPDAAAPRLDPRLARRLATKKAQLDRQRPLLPHIVARLQEDLRLLLTYHSNAIEGNTLSLRETQIVLESGLTIGGHPLREHLEATNHAAAFDYLLPLAAGQEPVTHATILALHRLVMQGIAPDAGQFRQGPVYIRGARFTPPPAGQVGPLLAAWLEWPAGPGLDYPPLVRLAIAHYDFEAIHPFTDGNGRTGRLLLNLGLLRAGYPPALLLRDWRQAYVRALDASNEGRYNALVNLVGRAVEGGLDLYLAACVVHPDDPYQLLATLAREHGMSADYLGWLVRRGRLAAVKRGGRWYSTPEAILQYQAEVTAGQVPRGRPPGRSGDVPAAP